MITTEREPVRQVQSLFLSLPTELVIETIAHLSGDRRSLCALAQTCRLVQPLCEEYIYATIELLSTDDLRAIRDAFIRRPTRISAVHTLKILYKYHEDLAATIGERTAFNDCVSKMTALKEWYVESPFDNFKWDDEGGSEWVQQDMGAFRAALETASLHQGQPLREHVGMAKLEHLTVHSHGADSDFWELDGFHCLFRHPALRYLHVSSVSLPSDLPQLEPFAATTPLTTLIFDECELAPDSLRRILSTPKSLKHLTLGENVANTRLSRGPSPKLSTAPEAAMRALMLVSQTLETLIHFDPMFATLRPMDAEHPPLVKMKAPGMRDFYHLAYMECDRCSFLHQGILMSRNLAPPNLETLRLRHYQGQVVDFCEDLPDVTPYTYLSSLKLLEFAQPITTPPQPFSLTSSIAAERYASHICDSQSLRERHAAAYKLWKCGIGMKLYAEMHRSSGLLSTYIPPYLHGEPVPDHVCVYSSDEVGFHRNVVDITEELPYTLVKDGDSQTFTVGHSQTRSPSRSQPGSPSGRTPQTAPVPQTELPETDQLSYADFLRIQNEVRRTMERYLASIGMKDIASSVALAEYDTEIDLDSDIDDDGISITLQEFLDDDDDVFEDADEDVDDDDEFMDAEDEDVDADDDLIADDLN